MLASRDILQGRYAILSLLGQGGMGAVYAASDKRTQARCVVKQLMIESTTPQEMQEAQRQFKQEAVTLANLRHPNLPHVSDYFGEGGSYFLVMDLIEGTSLHDLIAKGGLPEAQVMGYAAQLLDALAYCHSKHVLHRDIKPQNIIIQPNGRAMLVDFGLVKLDSATGRTQPVTQSFLRGMGTPHYAPPEQYSGGTDARSDLYALGATMYHALTGQVPPSVTDQLAGIKLAIPAVYARTTSARLRDAITKATMLDKSKRFQSADEFQSFLFQRTELEKGMSGVWVAVTIAGVLLVGALAIVIATRLPGGQMQPGEVVPTQSPGLPSPAATSPAATRTQPPAATLTSAPTTTLPPKLISTSVPTPLPTPSPMPPSQTPVSTPALSVAPLFTPPPSSTPSSVVTPLATATSNFAATTQARQDAIRATEVALDMLSTRVALEAAETAIAIRVAATPLPTATPTPQPPTSTLLPTDTPRPRPTSTPSPSTVSFVDDTMTLSLRSVRGNPIDAWKIGDDNANRVVLVVGGIEGGEQADTVSWATNTWQALRNQGRAQLERVLYVVVPKLNPDGVTSGSRFNDRDVDINRNWGTTNWKSNAPVPGFKNGKPGAGGKDKFSEPETRALRDLVLELKQRHAEVVIVVLHSSISGEPGVFPGYLAERQHAPSDALTRAFEKQLGLRYATEWSYDTPGELIRWAAENDMPAVDIVRRRDARPSGSDLADALQALFGSKN